MAYCASTDLLGYVPDDYLVFGTDDVNAKPGAVDATVFAQILAAVEIRIQALLTPHYTVTEPVNNFIKHCAIMLCVDHLFRRRGQVEHPWKSEVDRILSRLEAIGKGEEDIDDVVTDDFFEPETTRTPLIFDESLVPGAY